MEYIQKIEDFKIKPLLWQKAGKQYTATGYGSKIPTEYMIKVSDDCCRRWHRVYCSIYSNSGVLYIIVKKQVRYIDDTELEMLRDKYYQTHSAQEAKNEREQNL
jgi:hypothetical protein